MQICTHHIIERENGRIFYFCEYGSCCKEGGKRFPVLRKLNMHRMMRHNLDFVPPLKRGPKPKGERESCQAHNKPVQAAYSFTSTKPFCLVKMFPSHVRRNCWLVRPLYLRQDFDLLIMVLKHLNVRCFNKFVNNTRVCKGYA